MSNRHFSYGAALVLALSLCTSPALAWPAVDAAGNRVPVLGGRWTVALPENAVRAQPQLPPGAPAPREERDSATLVQSDEGNFGLRGTLLESTRPADLAMAVRALAAPCEAPTYGTIGERTDLVAIRCTTPSPDGAFRPITVYAVHTDGWVDRIEAMIETTNPADEEARTAGAAYAEAVMATLTAAEGPNAVERGTVDVARACGDEGGEGDHLTLALPENWILMRDPLGEGDLLRVTQVVPLGEERPMIAIELRPAGTEPPRLPEGVAGHIPATLLGGDVEWLGLREEGSTSAIQRLAAELTVDCGGGATFARAMRFSILGPPTTLPSGQTIVETLAFASTHGHTAVLTPVSSEEPPASDVPADGVTDEDREAEAQGHFWSYAIGGGSLLLLVIALVMRARGPRAK